MEDAKNILVSKCERYIGHDLPGIQFWGTLYRFYPKSMDCSHYIIWKKGAKYNNWSFQEQRTSGEKKNL